MEDFIAITPVNFFQISVDCHEMIDWSIEKFPFIGKKNSQKYLLPNTSAICEELSFADISIGWCSQGLEIYALVNRPFQKAVYPDVERGDSVELFVDTRDVKTSGFNTRFCHHFFFLAEGVEGHFAGEKTRFRTEDAHPLCDQNDIKIKVSTKSDHYVLHIFIPENCLHGYDPQQFNRLGFTYRINQASGSPQHFSVVTEDYQIEQQPSLWGSLKLTR